MGKLFMKNILILNGSPRKTGRTNKLVESFVRGAETNNDITEFHLYDMNLNGCMGCQSCRSNDSGNPCIQEDDMNLIYDAFLKADIIVFASPVYFWTVTGVLKTAVDRLYALLTILGYAEFEKESILIMTAGGVDYSQAQKWYESFEKNLNWKNLAEILGANKTEEAENLGKTIL